MTEDAALRSRIMRAVKGRDTAPELLVRKLAHGLGYRFRLHRVDLPGKPDLVFPSREKIIFVHGCFWHRHSGCKKASLPKSRPEYWHSKFSANVERDERVRAELEARGWKVATIWECETKNEVALRDTLHGILSSPYANGPTIEKH